MKLEIFTTQINNTLDKNNRPERATPNPTGEHHDKDKYSTLYRPDQQ
jgi:hypothetical protein